MLHADVGRARYIEATATSIPANGWMTCLMAKVCHVLHQGILPSACCSCYKLSHSGHQKLHRWMGHASVYAVVCAESFCTFAEIRNLSPAAVSLGVLVDVERTEKCPV